jgi:hypothetical protein
MLRDGVSSKRNLGMNLACIQRHISRAQCLLSMTDEPRLRVLAFQDPDYSRKKDVPGPIVWK